MPKLDQTFLTQEAADVSVFSQIIFIISLAVVELYAEDQLIYFPYETVCGVKLCSTDLPNMTISGGSRGNCAMRCFQVPSCRGFNWKNIGECQLYLYAPTAEKFQYVERCRHFIGMYCSFECINVWFQSWSWI